MKTQEELFNHVRDEEVNKYCMGLFFKKFDLENHDFEIEYSFSKFTTPEPHLAPYNDLVMLPDLESWN